MINNAQVAPNETVEADIKLKSNEPPGPPPYPDMVWISGGTFRMGSNDHYPEEAPVHQVTVDGFWMNKYQVTNAQFARFVKETGYVTVAERTPNHEDYPEAPPENLVSGSLVFQKTQGPVDLRQINLWWGWTVVSMKMTGSAFSPGSETMCVRTESRILLTTLILAGMGLGCYLLSSPTFQLFGITLLSIRDRRIFVGLEALEAFSKQINDKRKQP